MRRLRRRPPGEWTDSEFVNAVVLPGEDLTLTFPDGDTFYLPAATAREIELLQTVIAYFRGDSLVRGD